MRAAYARNGSKWIRRARRLAIYARDGWRCVWCKCDVYMQGGDIDLHPGQDATLDHVRPRAQGGSNKTENLVTSCMECNRKRGTKPAAEFAVEVARTLWARHCKARYLGGGDYLVPQGEDVREPAAFVRDVMGRIIDAISRPLP